MQACSCRSYYSGLTGSFSGMQQPASRGDILADRKGETSTEYCRAQIKRYRSSFIQVLFLGSACWVDCQLTPHTRRTTKAPSKKKHYLNRRNFQPEQSISTAHPVSLHGTEYTRPAKESVSVLFLHFTCISCS